MRRLLLAHALGACALLAGAARSQPVRPADGPFNVLVIMSDQHNTRTLGCYGNGYGGVVGSLTPNLDQLASEGVKFENAFCATPQCSPSRYTYLTGRWPHNHGLRWNGIWEPRGEATLPRLARDVGYVTASLGKHHLRWLDQPQPLEEDQGFSIVRDFQDYADYCQSHGQSTYRARGNHFAMPGLPAVLDTTGFTFNTNEFHPAGFVADEVIDFLTERAVDEQPFVCWYSMYGPHTPILPTGPADPQDWAHMYHPYANLDLPPNLDKVATTQRLTNLQTTLSGVSNDESREILSYYYGLITQIDWNIGRVLFALEQLDLARETVVVYVSDHGEMASEMRCWTKGAGHYDATARIPLIVRLPGILPAGKVVEEMTSGVDLAPTLLELTGVPVSDAVRERVDGRSLVDLMLGDQAPDDWPEEVFAELGLPNSVSVGRARMVRTREAKYTHDDLGGGAEEYYDLVADEYELDDRIGDPAVQQAVDDLRARLDAWWDAELGHAPPYAITGASNLAPSRSKNPVPPDGDVGVRRDVDPSWLPSTAAALQRVYFGREAGSLPLFATLEALEATFNPGSLDPSETYYWRVEQVNANGASAGQVWSFTTAATGSGGPGLAAIPRPAHGDDLVNLAARIEWTPAAGALSQSLHFGFPGQLQLVSSSLAGDAGAFDPGRLTAGTEYAWRIDATSAAGTTEGDVWTFTTDPLGLPGRARADYPEHLDEAVALVRPLALRWTPGRGSISHDVYFGASFPLPFRGNVAEASFAPRDLEAGRTYYWRIDEVSSDGTVPGWTWRFTTEAPRPIDVLPR